MFLGLDCLGEKVFENVIVTGDFNYCEIGNGKFDALYITISENENMENVKNDYWETGKTILFTDFDNSIKGGNVYGNLNIKAIKIKRRKVGDVRFEDLKIVPYTPDKITYVYVDNFVEALEEYEYMIQPIATNGALGNSISKKIEVEDFTGAWFVTEDDMVHCTHALQIGGYAIKMAKKTVETMGYQYPFVMTNGEINYRTGKLDCVLVSSHTEKAIAINKKQEKINRERIRKFFTDKTPMVFKDSTGEYMVISVDGEPEFLPINELKQALTKFSVGFTEVKGKDLLALHHAGIIK